MSNDFAYFTADEADLFSFYRIPKLLITDPRYKKLSAEAKLLYGLMLDRVGLSRKNGWVDSKRRVYIIYPVQDICDDLCVGRDKAYKMIKELEEIKLINRQKRGQGLKDLIYVRNFSSCVAQSYPQYEQSTDSKVEEQPFQNTENHNSESQNTENHNSGILDFSNQELWNSSQKNNNKGSKTEGSINPSINQSCNTRMDGLMDESEPPTMTRIRIEDQIGYLTFAQDKDTAAIANEIVDILEDVITIERKSIRICGTDYPWAHVRDRFRKLTYMDVASVINGLYFQDVTHIRNKRSYLLSCLYNANAASASAIDFRSTYLPAFG